MADTNNAHLCELLVDLRKSRKYSLRKMEQVCGVSRESIRKYENGILIPSNQTLQKIFENLTIDPKESTEARSILISVYQTRRSRSSGDIRSFGPAAQAEIESLFSDEESLESKADSLVELFFKQVSPDRRNDSLEFFLKSKILGILRS